MKSPLSRRAGILLVTLFALHAAAPVVPAAAQSAGAQSAGAQSAGAQSAAGQAALQGMTFAVENMFCALCPVTVRKAMEGVEGVTSVEVDFESKTALVTFDPAVTTATAIAAASTDAGYPARPGG